MLWQVISTVFFAITVAYVLYPFRQLLVRHGFDHRIAAALSTLLAFSAAAALAVPLLWSLYRRRDSLLAYLRALPSEFAVDVFGFTYAVTLQLSFYITSWVTASERAEGFPRFTAPTRQDSPKTTPRRQSPGAGPVSPTR